MSPGFKEIKTDGAAVIVTFENAETANSARAMLLLSGIHARDLNLTEANLQSEQSGNVVTVKENTQKKVETLLSSSQDIVPSLQKHFAALGTKLASPSITFSDNKWKLAFTLDDPSSWQQKSDDLAKSLKVGAVLDKTGSALEIPTLAPISKIPSLKESLKQAPRPSILSSAAPVVLVPTNPSAIKIKSEITKLPGVAGIIVEVKDYTVKEADGNIEVAFTGNTNKASAIHALLLMSGMSPDAITRDESGAQLNIKGMNEADFNKFHAEWLGKDGLIANLQAPEKNKGALLDSMPTIRIRSSGKAQAVLPLKVEFNDADSAHLKPLGLFVDQLKQKGIEAYPVKVGEQSYLDITTDEGKNLLEGLKTYLHVPKYANKATEKLPARPGL